MHVGQVEREVDDASAGRRQVGARKHRADQEALHDGRRGERRQEEEDHRGVAVRQDIPPLEGGEGEGRGRGRDENRQEG